MNLNKLSKKIFESAEKKGLYENTTGQDLIMKLYEEMQELQIAFEKGIYCTSVYAFENGVKNTFEDELADIIIMALSIAGKNNIDIDFHVKAKIKYNEERKR
jgi:NTP pyrophosphatase (non-canonical NTP hydrolase)